MTYRKNASYPLYEGFPEIHNLMEMVEYRASVSPDAAAFAYFDKEGNCRFVSYKEFLSQTRALINLMVSKGLEGIHIGILGENCYEWIVIYMAITCSGNVAVCFDKDMDEDELLQLMAHTETEYFFVSDKCEKKFASVFVARALRYMRFREINHTMLLDEENENLMEINTEDVCSIFFTSGTSGRRKAVMLSHGNIAADINGTCKLLLIEGNTYAVLPFHHTFGLIVCILGVFNYGNTIYINSGLKKISQEIKRVKPRTMIVVPLYIETLYKQIVQQARKSRQEKRLKKAMVLADFLLKLGIDVRKRLFQDVRSAFGGNLECIVCGGAALDKMYIAWFRTLGIEILNGYGTSECSPVVAVNRNRYHRDGSVGIAVSGTEVSLDDDGEILVKGPHVMLGYFNDEATTREALDGGCYHTGDIGKVDEDGFIYLIGRKKNLIILSNGENVSPEEIEERLLRFEDIEEVIVSAKGGHICAEIYPYSNEALEMLESQEHIKGEIAEMNKRLPTYKQITEVVFRDKPFEKTTAQKIKR